MKQLRGWKAIVGIGIVVLAMAGVVIVAERGPILRWLGSLLVIEDKLARADAILPLAGGTFDREIEAAELFKNGHAPRIVLTREPELSTRAYLNEWGIHLRSAEEVRLDMLVALGVPRDRVTVIAEPIASTIEEAQVVADWAAKESVRTLIVVSSAQHTARAKYIFERYAGSGAIRVIMRPARLSAFKPQSWWARRDTLREGIIEFEKLIVYRLWY